MKTVKIKVSSHQTDCSTNQEDTVELITEATLEQKDGFFVINYDESCITESVENKTRLKISKDKMLMTKIGEFSSKMEFEPGKKNTNIYVTPYGSFDIEFTTLKYNYCLSDLGIGHVEAEYKMVLGKEGEGYNKLDIEIS